MKKLLSRLVFGLLVLGFLFINYQSFVYAQDDDLIGQVNQIRENHNLPPFKVNSILNQSANNKACDMMQFNYFDHTSPDGKEFDWWIKEVNYQALGYGENLAQNYDSDAEMLDAWMNSPSHRENILHNKYNEIGVGKCGTCVVLHFGKRYSENDKFWMFYKFISSRKKILNNFTTN